MSYINKRAFRINSSQLFLNDTWYTNREEGSVRYKKKPDTSEAPFFKLRAYPMYRIVTEIGEDTSPSSIDDILNDINLSDEIEIEED